jgi:hypothetical protein
MYPQIKEFQRAESTQDNPDETIDDYRLEVDIIIARHYLGWLERFGRVWINPAMTSEIGWSIVRVEAFISACERFKADKNALASHLLSKKDSE